MINARLTADRIESAEDARAAFSALAYRYDTTEARRFFKAFARWRHDGGFSGDVGLSPSEESEILRSALTARCLTEAGMIATHRWAPNGEAQSPAQRFGLSLTKINFYASNNDYCLTLNEWASVIQHSTREALHDPAAMGAWLIAAHNTAHWLVGIGLTSEAEQLLCTALRISHSITGDSPTANWLNSVRAWAASIEGRLEDAHNILDRSVAAALNQTSGPDYMQLASLIEFRALLHFREKRPDRAARALQARDAWPQGAWTYNAKWRKDWMALLVRIASGDDVDEAALNDMLQNPMYPNFGYDAHTLITAAQCGHGADFSRYAAIGVRSRIAQIMQASRDIRRDMTEYPRINLHPAYSWLRSAFGHHRSQHMWMRRFAALAELRDDKTGRHGLRVGWLAHAIAVEMGVASEDDPRYVTAGCLHDLGKMMIPDAILNKPGPLTHQEYHIMKQHATLGAALLDASPSYAMELAAAGAASHHERWDGRGYPYGLTGGDIPLIGRILAVADCFDACANSRIYKAAEDPNDALDRIEADSGRSFDPMVIAAVRRLRQKAPATLLVHPKQHALKMRDDLGLSHARASLAEAQEGLERLASPVGARVGAQRRTA